MDDQEAVARLQAGDLRGLEPLVRRYQIRALRAAILITQDRALAEDAVQEAFLRFYQSIHQFDADRPVAPYFLRIVVNTALNLTRRERQSIPLDHSIAEVESLLARADGIEQEIERDFLAAEVERALTNLTPRQRAVIVQRYYLGLSEKEIAHRLEVTPGTVKRLLYNARQRLRRLLRLHKDEYHANRS
ncbi:sigma-70 family RNA polymerase sigma factor [Candidatus Parcubacteria bacterium]|nr:MAG: sigma-70 family RNA polymerase sigma factor [Candidatus Parcubacteria bacterium]